MGKKYISITKGAFDVLLPRLVSEMSIKRLLLMIVSENERYRVIAVGYAV